MASATDASNFDVALGCLYSSQLDELAAQLQSVAGLHREDRASLIEAAREGIASTLHAKLCRLLITELHAAKARGALSGQSSAERWSFFMKSAAALDFWVGLDERYPTVRRRIRGIVVNRCGASLALARHLAQDRAHLARLGFSGRVAQASFGAGDSHCGGKSVAVLVDPAGARLVYKPRSLRIDATLRAFVGTILEQASFRSEVRIPRVIDGVDHGWSEFIQHRYASDAVLHRFYRSVGHWLSLMRLLGGSDLHAENLIAHGSEPVVVDCETLFTPVVRGKPTGLGAAPEHASDLLSRSVLTVGLLPGRGLGLGWRGVDGSALGLLPGQQPRMKVPTVVGAGTDEARIGFEFVDAPPAQNHPSREPALATHWPEVLAGFAEMDAHLRALDQSGALRRALEGFADCRIRVVVRATEVYAELGRMLWHPLSLQDEDAARARATQLLSLMADNVAMAPNSPEVIAAEIDDLLIGDVPYFSCIAAHGRLDGPGGTQWLPATDLVESALENWRSTDASLDRKIIQASVVSAYLNDGWTPTETTLRTSPDAGMQKERERQTLAREAFGAIAAEAIWGEDGTITWIAPALNPTGWVVQPLEADLYSGLSGIAVLAAAYLHESRAGRVEPLSSAEEILRASLLTLRLAEEKLLSNIASGKKMRPPQVGAYNGVGSIIWTHLLLDSLGVHDEDLIARAGRLAEVLPGLLRYDVQYDLLAGAAGAIAALLPLVQRTQDEAHLATALACGSHLLSSAVRDASAAYWPGPQWPKGVGGFAHGASGVGWALRRLGDVASNQEFVQLSEEAFRFEQRLFTPAIGWLDLRNDDPDAPMEARFAAAWCHGAVGIGLAAIDLDPRLELPGTAEMIHTATAHALAQGVGWNHTLCHGDLGVWELCLEANRRGLLDDDALDRMERSTLASIRRHGPCSGFVRDSIAPGLLPGVGGIAYQLLRMHPESELPSVLIPGSVRARPG